MNEPLYHLDGVVRAKAETLEDFDGPLDVILLLLSKNKIEIQDVNITSILEQYLAWLDERKRMDMDVASEFIAMASHLMYIKTRMLLSKAEQEEAENDMEILIRSLRERQSKEAYEQIKIASAQLAVRNEIGLGLFTKGQEPYQRDHTYRYRHDPSDLLTALANIADRSERRLPPPVSNFAGIVGLSNTAFTLRVSFTTLPLKQWTVRFALDSQVKKHFDLAGVRAPVQTYQVLPAPGAAPAEPLPPGEPTL